MTSLQSPIQAPSVILMGATGTGKTTSIATLAAAGITCHVVITEPTGLESLIDTWIEKKLNPDLLRYTQINPAREDLTGIVDTAKKISISDAQQLASMKPSANRKDSQWFKLLQSIQDFKDDRTGKSYGPVQKLGPKDAFIIDSLSGMNIMAMDLVLGDKVTASPGEWGLAMKSIEKLLSFLCSNLKCTFVLTAHLEKETNEVTGGTQIYASTLGKKLAPTLPRFFSEVVMAHREADKFYWSTSNFGVDLKNRALPIGSKLLPDFSPIVRKYQERQAFLNPKT